MKSGYCRECANHVLLTEDGSCTNGHPAYPVDGDHRTEPNGPPVSSCVRQEVPRWAAALWGFVLLGATLFMALWPLMFGVTFASPGLAPRWAMNATLGVDSVGWLLAMDVILFLALGALSCAHAFAWSGLADQRKLLWTMIIFAGGQLGLLAYWYMNVWRWPARHTKPPTNPGIRHPLWERIDQLRYARALLLAQFLVAWTILLAAPLAATSYSVLTVILLAKKASAPPITYGRLLEWSAATAAVLGVLFIAWVMFSGREWRCLARLGTRRAMPGECETTRDALHDISLAAGLCPIPALYLIPDDAAVNAVVLGRSPRFAAVAVTTGMAYRCPKDLQRAVFAGLLSRFRNGGVGWTTVRFMLMEPISRAIRLHGVSALLAAAAFELTAFLAFLGILSYYGDPTPTSRAVGSLITAAIITISAITVVGWVLDRSFKKNYAALVLSADAEGVSLLGEPTMMLAALKSLLGVDSWLDHADGLSSLAFVDPSRASTLERPTELDRQRMLLLEELAFPSPPGSVAAIGITPLHSPADQTYRRAAANVSAVAEPVGPERASEA